ncbi:hypothetical protein CesoFtcFv8_002851 [Champsocephalus esox]|uniref:Uncharacterized protein n=1 Tax=Champsocephalus esox TaxID=159716 RepID=A0AAN8D276_9TELE|nr:hypothetical protein CesoFtcFv8_002851 [Champsocephalus esox]
MPCLLQQCGVAVWEASCSSALPESDRKAGQIVTAAIVALLQVSSSHQAPAAPSVLCYCMWCHLSANLPSPWGEGEVGPRKPLPFFCPIISYSEQEAVDVDRSKTGHPL